jgi:hypothetical protein
MVLPAEIIEFVEYLDGLAQRQRSPVTAVVTVPAMEVAPLSDMPLQGKGRGDERGCVG